MCAPVSATVGSSLASTSFATAMLLNQIIAIGTILSIACYKVVKAVKSL